MERPKKGQRSWNQTETRANATPSLIGPRVHFRAAWRGALLLGAVPVSPGPAARRPGGQLEQPVPREPIADRGPAGAQPGPDGQPAAAAQLPAPPPATAGAGGQNGRDRKPPAAAVYGRWVRGGGGVSKQDFWITVLQAAQSRKKGGFLWSEFSSCPRDKSLLDVIVHFFFWLSDAPYLAVWDSQESVA